MGTPYTKVNGAGKNVDAQPLKAPEKKSLEQLTFEDILPDTETAKSTLAAIQKFEEGSITGVASLAEWCADNQSTPDKFMFEVAEVLEDKSSWCDNIQEFTKALRTAGIDFTALSEGVVREKKAAPSNNAWAGGDIRPTSGGTGWFQK